ncbi:MAG: prepilin-type N-terminal cleavage/methylation domain-containing protein [Planctomycetes bacterium]|nr:prepilin-type N-terminal cleavage/methylation domain-containing protein [Planctomycetota bacterium]
MLMPRDRNPAAFSLVEIIIVILVLAIAAAIVIPSIGSADDSQAVSAASILQGDLEVARSMAMTTQRPHSVVFSPDLQSYKVVANYAGGAYGWAVAVNHPVNAGKRFEVRLGRMSGMGDVRVTAVNFGGLTYVTFLALGDPSAAGSVRIEAGHVVMTVSVEALTGIVAAVRTAG